MAARTFSSGRLSVFEHEAADPQVFSLSRLGEVVSEYFGEACDLVKLQEGGYHKVYDVIAQASSTKIKAVVRVASSAFPQDKIRSEIATLKYIASHTSVPVPTVYAWDTDASNRVGAEYMIMEKVPGIAPYGDVWDALPVAVKLNVVEQVAEHMAILFSLRFEQAGSLYLPPDDSPQEVQVGPIVSLPFYRVIDGIVNYPEMSTSVEAKLEALRGPFSSTSDYLASFLEPKLLQIEHCRTSLLESIVSDDPSATVEMVQQTIQLALDLCRSYPGDRPIPNPLSTPDRPFTLLLDDFRLTNIIIDEVTGKINGYIDFEATTVAPLWQSTTVPDWIPDPDGDTAGWNGGTSGDQRALWSAFHAAMDKHDHELTGGEWRLAYEGGKAFRQFADRLPLGTLYWDEEMKTWIKERSKWSERHPGVGMLEKGSM